MRWAALLSLPLLPLSAAMPKILIEAADAAPVANLPLEISNMGFTCSRPADVAPYGCDLRYDMYDPNSEIWANVSRVSCGHSWSWDGVSLLNGDFNGSYTMCWMGDTDHAFQSTIKQFGSPGNFTMWININYSVPGETSSDPDDNLHLFFEPNVALHQVTALHNSMYFISSGVMKVNLTGMSM